MNDRELLEMAARAAGIDVYESTDGTIQNRPILAFQAGGRMGTMPYEVQWNPLLEDAQAFRLAVKLRLHILHNDPGEPVLWVSAVLNKRMLHGVAEFNDEPKRAEATRRAIVRAAAAIGSKHENLPHLQ